MPSDLIRGWTPVRVKKTRQNKSLDVEMLAESAAYYSAEATALNVCGTSVDAPTRITGATFGR